MGLATIYPPLSFLEALNISILRTSTQKTRSTKSACLQNLYSLTHCCSSALRCKPFPLALQHLLRDYKEIERSDTCSSFSQILYLMLKDKLQLRYTREPNKCNLFGQARIIQRTFSIRQSPITLTCKLDSLRFQFLTTPQNWASTNTYVSEAWFK